MSWSVPRTWVDDEVVTESLLNTHVRDNLAWLATDKPGARVYRTGAQSVPDTTVTACTFDAERRDNAGIHSTATNTSRLTVPPGADGLWLAGAHLQFAANAAGKGWPGAEDVASLNARRDAYNSRAADLNRRGLDFRLAQDEFNRQVSRYNLMATYPDGLDEAPAAPAKIVR